MSGGKAIPMKPHRVGIIGFGFIGKVHAYGYLNLPFYYDPLPLGGTRGWRLIDTGQRYPKPASGFPGGKVSPGWLRGHVACLAHFLQCVAEGKPGDPGLAQGIYVQRLMECARESARDGAWRQV